ncbi:MAG: NAD-dependent protein deacylase [Thermoprotei archaeon]|jgi:NAD-dependent deacetylase
MTAPLELIKEVSKTLAYSKYLVALTGSGISVGAGIPTFRGPDGLWLRLDPNKFTLSYFLEKPYEWWNMVKDLMESFLKAKPTPSHKALTELERLGLLKGIITQNIDELHQKAGSSNVVELHGNISKLKCPICKAEYNAKPFISKIKKGIIPACENCGSILKPTAVLFDESIPKDAYMKALQLSLNADTMLVIGTSLAVEPAASLPIKAFERGSKLIVINILETPIDDLAYHILRAPTDEILPKIVKIIKTHYKDHIQ